MENKPKITLETCRKMHPEISTVTFHWTMSTLDKYNLVKKIPLSKRRLSYQKTKEYTTEKGTAIIKAHLRSLRGKRKKRR